MMGLSGNLGLPSGGGGVPPMLKGLMPTTIESNIGSALGGLGGSGGGGSAVSLPGLNGLADITASTGVPDIANMNPSRLMSSSSLGVMNMVNSAAGNAQKLFKNAQSWLASAPSISASTASMGAGVVSASNNNSVPTGSGNAKDIIDAAKSQIGTTANQAVNKYSRGKRQLWCADFVSTILQQNGIDIPHMPAVQQFLNHARKSGNGSRFISKSEGPKEGDVMIQKQNGVSHVAIVTKVNGDGTFETVGGNEKGGTNSAQVRHNTRRRLSDPSLTGFARFT